MAAGPALAQNTVKIGVTLGLTGPLQIIGTEALAGMRLYMAEHGDTVAGKKIELIVKDDGARRRERQANSARVDRPRQGRSLPASA